MNETECLPNMLNRQGLIRIWVETKGSTRTCYMQSDFFVNKEKIRLYPDFSTDFSVQDIFQYLEADIARRVGVHPKNPMGANLMSNVAGILKLTQRPEIVNQYSSIQERLHSLYLLGHISAIENQQALVALDQYWEELAGQPCLTFEEAINLATNKEFEGKSFKEIIRSICSNWDFRPVGWELYLFLKAA